MTPYRADPGDAKHHPLVTGMFDRIAHRYDRLNRIMTLGLDVWWRTQLVWSLDPARHRAVLDACTGTGDVALGLARRGHIVVGLDAAPHMLGIARRKDHGRDVRWCEGNCLELPFPDAAFDALTVAFGIRNIADRVGALCEFNRIVRPGGAIRVLEVLEPKSPIWGRIIKGYQRFVIPVIGAVFAGQRSAYEYFARSIAGFGTVEEFEAELRESGWTPEEARWLTGGSVVLFGARKAGSLSGARVVSRG